MLKFLGIAALGIICFLVALLIPIALSGNLNAETIGGLFGGDGPSKATKTSDDNLGSLHASLQAEAKRLQALDTKLAEEEARIAQRQNELDDTLTQITQIQTDIAAAMDTLDTEQQENITQIAKTMEAMNPENAATDLQAMSPEEAARILPLIKGRSRGKILDAMVADKRSLILQVMQERKY